MGKHMLSIPKFINSNPDISTGGKKGSQERGNKLGTGAAASQRRLSGARRANGSTQVMTGKFCFSWYFVNPQNAKTLVLFSFLFFSFLSVEDVTKQVEHDMQQG